MPIDECRPADRALDVPLSDMTLMFEVGWRLCAMHLNVTQHSKPTTSWQTIGGIKIVLLSNAN